MQITVYTTPTCPQCDMTKKVLTKGEVEFDIVDLTSNEEALQYVTQELGYNSAPVVVVDDEHWSGFRPALLNKLVDSSRTTAAIGVAA